MVDSSEYRPRVGVLGGSFNPPTIGHMQMGLEAINRGLIDELWIVPCGDRADKKTMLEGSHRLKMLEILVESYFRNEFPVKIDDREIRNVTTIPTYYLMKAFTEENPEKDIFFILGSDLLAGLRSWENGVEFAEKFNFMIYNRVGYSYNEKDLPANYIILQTTFVGASSTLARSRIRTVWKKTEVFLSESDDSVKPKASSALLLGKPKTLKQKELEDKWLNVYGILSFEIIDYIRKNKLYDD